VAGVDAWATVEPVPLAVRPPPEEWPVVTSRSRRTAATTMPAARLRIGPRIFIAIPSLAQRCIAHRLWHRLPGPLSASLCTDRGSVPIGRTGPGLMCVVLPGHAAYRALDERARAPAPSGPARTRGRVGAASGPAGGRPVAAARATLNRPALG